MRLRAYQEIQRGTQNLTELEFTHVDRVLELTKALQTALATRAA